MVRSILVSLIMCCVAAVSLMSTAADRVADFVINTLAFGDTAALDIRVDTTPRSIFEARRLGLA